MSNRIDGTTSAPMLPADDDLSAVESSAPEKNQTNEVDGMERFPENFNDLLPILTEQRNRLGTLEPDLAGKAPEDVLEARVLEKVEAASPGASRFESVKNLTRGMAKHLVDIAPQPLVATGKEVLAVGKLITEIPSMVLDPVVEDLEGLEPGDHMTLRGELRVYGTGEGYQAEVKKLEDGTFEVTMEPVGAVAAYKPSGKVGVQVAPSVKVAVSDARAVNELLSKPFSSLKLPTPGKEIALGEGSATIISIQAGAGVFGDANVENFGIGGAQTRTTGVEVRDDQRYLVQSYSQMVDASTPATKFSSEELRALQHLPPCLMEAMNQLPAPLADTLKELSRNTPVPGKLAVMADAEIRLGQETRTLRPIDRTGAVIVESRVTLDIRVGGERFVVEFERAAEAENAHYRPTTHLDTLDADFSYRITQYSQQGRHLDLEVGPLRAGLERGIWKQQELRYYENKSDRGEARQRMLRREL